LENSTLPELPLRQGTVPNTSQVPPHLQLDQWPPAAIHEELLRRCIGLPQVSSRESRLARAETQALWICDDLARGRREAFIDDHEFCHIHPLPEGSLHMTLPGVVRRMAFCRGWAQQHIIARAGLLPEQLVLVYAPRDHMELGVVMSLVEVSCQFALGSSFPGDTPPAT